MKFPPLAPLKYLREVFSEDGKGSYSRFCGGAIVFATIGWVTYLVKINHALPDLSGPSMFVSIGAASHYGINKATDIIAAWRKSGQPDNPGPTPTA